MNRTVVLSVLPAFVAVSLFAAREEPVTVWRGETAAFRLHDHVSLGDVPAGFAIREGVAQEVRYLDRQFGSHYRFAADRVVWGSKEIGPRIVEIGVPQETKGGVYSCGDLRITVLDRVLPPAKDWKYNLDLWQHPWAVARYRGVKPFSSDHYEAMRPLWRMLADAGQKSLTTTLLDVDAPASKPFTLAAAGDFMLNVSEDTTGSGVLKKTGVGKITVSKWTGTAKLRLAEGSIKTPRLDGYTGGTVIVDGDAVTFTGADTLSGTIQVQYNGTIAAAEATYPVLNAPTLTSASQVAISAAIPEKYEGAAKLENGVVSLVVTKKVAPLPDEDKGTKPVLLWQ